MAATSTHGPGAIPQGPGQIQYSNAVFQAFDDNATSRSASASTAPRDSPVPHPPAAAAAAAAAAHQRIPTPSSTPISAGPFTYKSNARLTPFPSSFSRSLELDIEPAQSLIRLSASVEPIGAIPRDEYSHSHPSQPVSATSVNNVFVPLHAPVAASVPVPASVSKVECDGSPHPSTSPEDQIGRQSDVFSVGENSDTISDPDVDTDKSFPGHPQPQFLPPASPRIEEGAPRIAQPVPVAPYRTATNGFPAFTTQYPPNGHNVESASQAPKVSQSQYQVPQDHTPAASQMYCKLYDPSAPVLPTHSTHCTCQAVSAELLRILDAPDDQTPNIDYLVKLWGACKDDLCSLHKDAYARVITNAVINISMPPMAVPAPQTTEVPEIQEPETQEPFCFDHEPVITGSGTKWRSVPYRRRATSNPAIYEYELDHIPSKRPRLAESPEPSWSNHSAQSASGIKYSRRPRADPGFDERFRRQVLGELAHDFTDLKEDDWSRGECTNRYIHAILSKCRLPNTDPRKGAVDAGVLSGQEAADAVERGTERMPIFTEGQQQFQWKKKTRPISQLFARMEDLTREVSVQIPSRGFDLPSYQTKSLTEIQERFFAETPSRDPWNILDLRSPLPPSILPSFLTGENCQLLPRIRDSLLEGHTAERTKASREDWNEWTDLLEWVLMSEGGHNTAPHMDSHGWSTWITIQEGNFGFGWLSRPTDKEREEWMTDPLGYTGGNWRFAILKPGQTVFFPSGTVHFVFRLQDRQTLALGGHLLQWTALERWVQVILWQLKNPNITNEDLGKSPLKYIHIASNLVKHRMQSFRIQTMGGMPAVTQFMARASEVERWFNRRQRKRLR